MTVKDVKKYQIECDFCGAVEIIERAEGGFMTSPRPEGWKNTYWHRPRFTSAGPTPGGSVDQCPKCLDKEVELPDNATDVRTKVY